MGLSSFSLEGRVAIVTGAGGIKGMGRATALAFADAGADVAVCDLHATGDTFDLEGTAEEVRKLGRKSIAVQTDATKPDEVAELVKKTMKEFGKVDILANVVGMAVHVPFKDTTYEHFDTAMEVNLKSQFICIKEVSKAMLEGNGGSIINWSSLAAVKTGAGFIYGVSKQGIHALTAWTAKELAPTIRVNAIVPGGVMTDFGRHGISMMAPPPSASGDAKPDPEAMRKRMAEMIPVGRMAEPHEIADVALFLASNAACQVTGHVLYCEGGMALS